MNGLDVVLILLAVLAAVGGWRLGFVARAVGLGRRRAGPGRWPSLVLPRLLNRLELASETAIAGARRRGPGPAGVDRPGPRCRHREPPAGPGAQRRWAAPWTPPADRCSASWACWSWPGWCCRSWPRPRLAVLGGPELRGGPLHHRPPARPAGRSWPAGRHLVGGRLPRGVRRAAARPGAPARRRPTARITPGGAGPRWRPARSGSRARPAAGCRRAAASWSPPTWWSPTPTSWRGDTVGRADRRRTAGGPTATWWRSTPSVDLALLAHRPRPAGAAAGRPGRRATGGGARLPRRRPAAHRRRSRSASSCRPGAPTSTTGEPWTGAVLVLAGDLAPGDSGCALVEPTGRSSGWPSPSPPTGPGVAYALDQAELRRPAGPVAAGPVDTGPCLR